MSIPGGDLTLLRSVPQTSKLYLVIQQPEYSTDDGATWTGYDWSCRIDGAHTDDPTVTLTVDGGAAATDLLDGMTVLIGSSKYGDWDHGVYRVRGDQTVDGATVALDIGTSSEVRGVVTDDDYVVVLDEFRFWQRYGRITAPPVVWYKDYDIQWSDLGATDAARRLAMMPPVPVMGPHAVKFVEIGGTASTFYYDWQDSYAPAVGETVSTWTSEGEQDHAGTTWNSAAETPGWQTTDDISGLRGFRVTLEVDDGNGNAATLPYRRGVRYVFTLRRPGETQVGDPDNAEPLTEFELGEPVSGDFEQGYWRTSITVFESEASRYNIMPEALVILFTEDVYGTTAGSLGPITDRENILLVGRIVDGTIRTNPETGDVTFDVASPGAEIAMYHNYPIVIQNNTLAATWIDTPDLTVDRAIHYYTTWHTTLNLVADLYQIGSTTEIYSQDFLEGDIYSTLNQFMDNRLFARVLCDKYGRFHCEVDANERAFGSTTTQWTMQTGDWLDEVDIRQITVPPVNGVECGGLIYNEGAVIPKLSHAPGLFDKYRGARQASTSLAIDSQDALNTTTGRHLAALNYEFEIGFQLAGNWRYCDIAPQRVVDIGTLTTYRQTLTGDYIVRAVSNGYLPGEGVIFTEIRTEQETGDGVAAGVTIDIPEDLPIPSRQYPKIPIPPGLPPLPGWPVAGEGRRIIATDVGVYVTDGITAASPVWYGVNTGFSTAEDKYVYSIARDPFHWWTSGGTERTLWCVSRSGVWKHEDFPYGTWVQQISYADFLTEFGLGDSAPHGIELSEINMSIETDGRYVVGLNISSAGMAAVVATCQGAAVLNWNHYFTAANAFGNWHSGAVGWHRVKYDPVSASQIIYSSPGESPFNVANAKRWLYRTANAGVAWAIVDGPYTFGSMDTWASISIPYEDGGSSIVWASQGTHRISTDGASSFGNVPNLAVTAAILGTSSRDDRLWSVADRPDATQCRYSIDSGATWTTVPLIPVGLQAYSGWTFWQGDFFRNALVGGEASGGAPAGVALIFSYDAGSAAWDDKTGNLAAFGPIAVYDIDRDSMGSA